MDLSDTLQLGRERPVLAFSPHALMPAKGRELIYGEFLHDETIGEYLRRTGIADRLRHRHVVLALNGIRVPRSFWEHCRPKPGTMIDIRAIVKDGKNPIATIAIIALTIWTAGGASGYAAAAAETFGGTAAGWAAGIAIIGAMAINKLLPPPKPKLSDTQPNNGSPTYTLTGGNNQARPFQPMPFACGTNKWVPDYGATFFTDFQGDDQYLYQIFDFGYNDVDLSNFMIGTTPLESFEGVTLQISDDTGALTLFPGNVDSISGAELDNSAGWISRTTSPDAVQIGIEITGLLYAIETHGNIVQWSVTLHFQYRAVGAAAWTDLLFDSDDVPYSTIIGTDPDNGAPELSDTIFIPLNQVPGNDVPAGEVVLFNSNTTPIHRTYTWIVPRGQYEVRVMRISADDTDPTRSSTLIWSQLRTYQPDDTDYTGRKRVALKIKASGQLNGPVDQFSCIARAKTQVFDIETESWVDGQQTSNPAWWFLAMLRGKIVNGRLVWGGAIDDSRIDLEGLKAFGAWCDSKGLTFDGIFDQPQSLYDMLSSIALMGRGTVSTQVGKHGVVWDAPSLPVSAVFGMPNIIAGSFEIDYANSQLADEIMCTFVNPDLNWQQDSVRVLVPGTTEPRRTRQIDLFGCTNKDLAGRAANLYAAQNAYRTRTYKWTADFEAMPVARGEVVQLSHDLASLDYSGRFIEGGDETNLKLPKEVPLSTGGAFIVIVKPDGTFDTYDVQGGSGMTDTLVATPPLPFNPWTDGDHPPYDYKWLYGATATPGKKVKIDSWTPNDERTIQVTAVDELDIFYTAETNPYTYVPPRPVFGGAPQISNLQLTEDGVRAGVGYLVKVTATWDVSTDFSFADVRVSVKGGPLQLLGQTIRARQFDFTVSDFSDVAVEITGYGQLGRLGKAAKINLSQTIDFAGLSAPADVTGFDLRGNTFTWDEAVDVDTIGLELRFHYGTRMTWEDAAPLHSGVLPSSPYTPPALPAGQCVFMAKWIDAAQLESAHATLIITDLGDPDVANVVETIDFASEGWPGTITNGAIVGPDLEATTSSPFYGPDDSGPLYTSDDTDPLYPAAVYNALTYETNSFAPSEADFGSMMTLLAAVAGDPYFVEYRPIGASTPLYVSDDGSTFYAPSDLDPFYDPAPDYAAWPGPLAAKNIALQLRVRTGQGAVQGIISQLKLEIDVPDIEETMDGVAIAPGGTRLPLVNTYRQIVDVQLTLRSDGGAAVTALVDDHNASAGPLVSTLNAAQAGVNGTVNARVKGF